MYFKKNGTGSLEYTEYMSFCRPENHLLHSRRTRSARSGRGGLLRTDRAYINYLTTPRLDEHSSRRTSARFAPRPGRQRPCQLLGPSSPNELDTHARTARHTPGVFILTARASFQWLPVTWEGYRNQRGGYG